VLPWKQGEAEPTDWSADGATVAFTAVASGRSAIHLLSMADRKSSPFISGPFDVGYARFSPDGRYVAYCSNESGRNEVYVQPFPDRSDKWQISTKGGLEPRWSADGKQIYYLAADQRLTSVTIRTTPVFEAGVPQPLFTLPVANPDVGRNHYLVSADGQRFFAVIPANTRSLPNTYVVVNWTGTETLTPQCTEARLYENGTDRARDADAGAGAGARRLRVLRRLPARRREGVGHAHVHVRDDDALSGWAAAHCPIRSHSAVRLEAKLWQWAESRSTYRVTSRLRG